MTRTDKSTPSSSPTIPLSKKKCHDSEIEELKKKVIALEKNGDRDRVMTLSLVGAARILFLLVVFLYCCWVSSINQSNISLHATQIQQFSVLHKQQTHRIENLVESITLEKNLLYQQIGMLKGQFDGICENYVNVTNTISQVSIMVDKLHVYAEMLIVPPENSKESPQSVFPVREPIQENSTNSTCEEWGRKSIRNRTQLCGFLKCLYFKRKNKTIDSVKLRFLNKLCKGIYEKRGSSVNEQIWILYDLYRPIAVFFYVCLGFLIGVCKVLQYLNREIEIATKEAVLFFRSLKWVVQ